MKIGVIPENVVEWIALALGRVPTPVMETHTTLILAQAIMVATKLKVFEALASGALTAQEVAMMCHAHLGAMQKLLNALVSAGYLRMDGERYVLAPVTQKWLLTHSQHSLHNFTIYRFVEWEWIKRLESFIRTGIPVRMHEEMSNNEWDIYQMGMRSLASSSASEVAKRTPVPKGARHMLDIGGSHGYYSVEICRRYPDLRATILDLPEAVEYATPILAKEDMGDRVVYQVGNALADDLGTDAYDLVLISNLVHHFDDKTNRDLVQRVARSLRIGGYLAIQEVVIRPRSPNDGGQLGGLSDLFFALTSEAGTWSLEEIASWQSEAGLVPQKPIRFMSLPGAAQQAAVKLFDGIT